MKGFVSIETSSQIRRRQQVEILERDRNFWQKTAEQLQDYLNQIFDAAVNDGRVTIMQGGKQVKLQIEAMAAPEASKPAA